MIKINLLGKRKASGPIPFGLDEKLAKLGIRPEDLLELRPALLRLGVLLAGLYLANYVPNELHRRKIEMLDAQIAEFAQQSSKLTAELATKRDIRKQMDQLNKEEVELQRQLNAVNALQKDRSLAFRTVDNIVVSLPQKVWLTKIEYQDRTMDLDGRCWEYFPINDFVKTINESTQYMNVAFRGIEAEAVQNKVQGVPEAVQKIKAFNVKFSVKGTGEG